MNRNAEDMFAVPDALAGMVRAMRRRLVCNPRDERALWSLGEALRMQGDLDEALNCYRAVLDAVPDHPGVRRLVAILGQDVLPESECRVGPRAAPFARQEAFLSDTERDAVWAVLRDGMSTMKKSGIGDGRGKRKINMEVRSSHVLYRPHLKAIDDWFRARVAARLERLWRRVGVEPFEIGRRELQLTTHQHGNFYRRHKDSGEGAIDGRRVTFVYYFHRRPRRFSGGDLLLYDTDLERSKALGKFTRLRVQDNSILFFPSGYYHQVMPVVCGSEDLEDGRLTLNGWIHAR